MKFLKIILILLFVIAGSKGFSQIILTVTEAGAGSKNGSSWADAMDSVGFRKQLRKAKPGTDFWIAAGKYHPEAYVDSSFRILCNRVRLYGGFSSTDTAFSSRDSKKNVTILSGDIKNDDSKASFSKMNSMANRGDNNFHVLTIIAFNGGIDDSTLLDGLVIEGGGNSKYANWGYYTTIYNAVISSMKGTAIEMYSQDTNHYCNPLIENCELRQNSFGVIVDATSFLGSTAPTFVNCSFHHNYGQDQEMIAMGKNKISSSKISFCSFDSNWVEKKAFLGTALVSIAECAKIRIENSSFSYNIASNTVKSYSAKLEIIRCAFIGNKSYTEAGAIFMSATSNKLDNLISESIFAKNYANNAGGAIYIEGSYSNTFTINIVNSTFLENNSHNDGNAIYADGKQANYDSCIIYNSIFNGNSKSYYKNIFFRNMMRFGLRNCLVQNLDYEMKMQNIDSHNECYDGNPRFRDTADIDGADNIIGTDDDGLQLDSGSIALNSGDTALVSNYISSTDYAGNPRINNCIIDMGAYESNDSIMNLYAEPGKDVLVCRGDSIGFAARGGGCGSISYQWRKDGVNIQGQTQKDLILKNVQMYDTGYYDAVVKSSNQSDSFITSAAKVSIYQFCNVRFVTPNGAGDKNGTTWANAMDNDSFEKVLGVAKKPFQFWLSEGLYMHPTKKRSGFYQITQNGISLYGGFATTDTLLSQRDLIKRKTIFSGDFSQNDSLSYSIPSKLFSDSSRLDNVQKILKIYLDGSFYQSYGYDTAVILDGLYFKGAAEYDITSNGAAVYYSINYTPNKKSYLIIKNCHFEQNSAKHGAGIYVDDGLQEPQSTIIQNTIFKDNYVKSRGAAIHYFDQGSYQKKFENKIENSYFINNTAGVGGGAIYTLKKFDILQSVFVNNSANEGAVLYAWQSPVFHNNFFFLNCTFSANEAKVGKIFYRASQIIPTTDTFNFQNCIFGGAGKFDTLLFNSDQVKVINTKLSNNIFKNSFARSACFNSFVTANNYISNPKFANPADIVGTDSIYGTADDGLNLSKNSIALNHGDTTGVSKYITNNDITGSSRIKNCALDIGAYEFEDSSRNVLLKTVADSLICKGDTVKMDAELYGCFSNVRYQWRRNGVDIAGALSSNFIIKGFSVNDTGTYEVIVKYYNTDSIISQSKTLYIYKQCKVIFVTVNGSGNKLGIDWNNAIDNQILRTMLQSGIPNQEFWIAKGIYYPDKDVDSSFRILANNTKLYGGFQITDSTLEQRTPLKNKTIFSGDILQNDSSKYYINSNLLNAAERKDNCNHVVTIISKVINKMDRSVVLDGLVILGGNARHNITQTKKISLYNIALDRDIGGGIYIHGGDACSPTIRNCEFVNNSAQDSGGGYAFINSYNNNIVISGCIFYNNFANGGAGIYCSSTSCFNMNIINSTFYNNDARKGAVYLLNSSASLYCVNSSIFNCIVWQYTGYKDSTLLYISKGKLKLTNSLLQNLKQNYNYMAGMMDTMDVLAAYPLFTDTVNADFTTQNTSAAINWGDSTLLVGYDHYANKDIAGNKRIQYCQVDAGAIESSGTINCCQSVSISSQSSSINICKGKDTSLFIHPLGNIRGFQWEDSSGGKWTKINGAIDSIYKVSKLISNKYFRCVLNGKCDTVYSNSIYLIPILPNIYNYSDSICKGQIYKFGNQQLSKAGKYYDTIVNSTGCDSIVALTLIVNAATNNIINATVCPGQGYLFNGQNIYNAGDYFDTLINASGCDSFLTLKLLVSQQIKSNVKVVICSGSAYMFNGNNLSTSGTYIDTIASSYGCDSIITLSLLVNPVSNYQFKDTICNGPYMFDGKKITNTGVYYDTLSNYLGCDSVVKLNLFVKPILHIGAITGNASPNQFATEDYNISSSSSNLYNWLVNGGVIQSGHGTNKISVKWGNYNSAASVQVSGDCMDTSYIGINVLNGLNQVPSSAPNVYPNPTSNEVVIVFNKHFRNCRASLFNYAGQLIKREQQFTGNRLNLDVSAYSTGVYILEIETDGEMYRCKINKL